MLYYENDERLKFINVVYVISGVYVVGVCILLLPHLGTIMDPVWSYKPLLTFNILELGGPRIAALQAAQRQELAVAYRYSEWLSFGFIAAAALTGAIAGFWRVSRPVLDGFSILVSVLSMLIFYALITNASAMLANLSGVKTATHGSLRIDAMPVMWVFTWTMSAIAIGRSLAVIMHDIAVCISDMVREDAPLESSPLGRVIGNKTKPIGAAPRFLDPKAPQPGIRAEGMLPGVVEGRVIGGMGKR